MRIRPTKEQFQEQLEHVTGTLRQEMIDGTLAPGSYLPPEKQLETRFGMSNYSIRIALEQLVQEGWIVKIASVGNRVVASRPAVKLSLVCNGVVVRNLKLDQLIAQFQRQHPWVTIDVITRYRGNEFIGEEEDDLVILDNVQFQALTEEMSMTYLEPLEATQHLYPQLLPHFEHKGQLLMQPVVFSPLILCYNKDHFDECGIPEPNGSWTWDELLHCAAQLSNGKGRYGFAFHMQSTYRWPLFLLQSGERFEWENGVCVNSPESKLFTGIALCRRMLRSKEAVPMLLSENNDDTDQMFLEGKLSMTLNTYMGLNQWENSGVPYDIAPVPSMEEQRTLVISMGIGLNRHSKHREEAKLFLDFLVSAAAQQTIWQHTLSVPALATLPLRLEEKKVYTPERYGLFRETLGAIRPMADLHLPISMLRPLSGLFKLYWAGMMELDELCERLRNLSAEHSMKQSV